MANTSSDITIEELERCFSRERLAKYGNFAEKNGGAPNELLAVYSWNIQLSQAFYPLLQLLEVSLRNALNGALTSRYSSEWLFNTILHEKDQKKVNEARANLLRENKLISTGKVIAELKFGFWTSLFDVRYEQNQVLWPHLLTAVFRYIPKRHRTRQVISRQLNRVRHLRNRIFHYEPIWHWFNLQETHQAILTIIGWISPMIRKYAITLDTFPIIYQQKNIIRE